MKNKFLSYIAALALAGSMTACDTFTPDVEVEGKGQLNTSSITPTVDNEVVETITGTQGAIKAQSRATIDISDFIIDVTNSLGQKVNTWTFSTMPELPEFPVGTYKVAVRSHDVKKSDWNKPYFLGEQTFEIRNGEVTTVPAITCKLANIMVTVEFDSKLVAASLNNGADLKVVVTADPGVKLEYSTTETRAGYFEATKGLTTLKVEFSGTVQGNAESTTAVLTNVAAGQHRKVIMKLKSNTNPSPDEVGNIKVDGQGINVDFSVVEKNINGNISANEENLDSSDRPNQEGEEPGGGQGGGGTDPQPQEVITFNSTNLKIDGTANDCAAFGPGVNAATVDIHSDAGIRNLNVEIVSNFLTESMLQGVGLTSKFDLANAGQYTEGLKGLGFKVNEEVVGKNDLTFDITQFIPLIMEAGDHKFIVTVTDKNGVQKGITLLFRKA